MLLRQKILLALLRESREPVRATTLVKLSFLLRQESVLGTEPTFYDFVPYKYGPFSFALYQELRGLRKQRLLTDDEESVSVREGAIRRVDEKIEGIPTQYRDAVREVSEQFGGASLTGLLRSVYRQYPWYAIRSERKDLAPKNLPDEPQLPPAVYTVGYEGKSVDGFFGQLMQSGIREVIDVRANPVSRKYGFARKSMSEIAHRLDIRYVHLPQLGISSAARADLSDYASYQRLLNRYERKTLPAQEDAVAEVVGLMRKNPAALLCMEKDVTCCHRGRLANRASEVSGLSVVHL